MTGTWEQHYAEAKAYYEQTDIWKYPVTHPYMCGYLSSAMPDGENGGR